MDAAGARRRSPRERLVRILRWCIERLGGESDTELHARVLRLYARSGVSGTRESIERAITEALPFGSSPEFIWDSAVCRGDRGRLIVVFR